MKVIFFTDYYPQYLEYFYNKNPLLEKASHEEQISAIINNHYVYWGGLVKNFREMGHDARLIISNNKTAQTAWASENNIAYHERDWQFTIPLEQLKKEQPDVLYMGSMFSYFDEFLDKARQHTKNIYGWLACRIPEGTPLSKLQLIISSLPSYIEDFKKSGLNSEYLHASFDSDILKKIDSEKIDIDFSFVGSLTADHKIRIAMIKKLIENTALQVYGRNVKQTLDERSILGKLLGSENKYASRVNKEVYALDMYRILKRSKVTFNKHIDISNEYAGNARMFEATGVGSLLLSDGKYTPNKLFNDDEVVYYENVDEAIEKVNYYLAHESERKAIAARGQAHTLSDYTCEKSAKTLLGYFEKYKA